MILGPTPPAKRDQSPPVLPVARDVGGLDQFLARGHAELPCPFPKLLEDRIGKRNASCGPLNAVAARKVAQGRSSSTSGSKTRDRCGFPRRIQDGSRYRGPLSIRLASNGRIRLGKLEDSSQKKINTGSILAVDSSTGTADHLKGILKRGGIEVTTVEDGETALKFYEEGKFDVVVSEIPVKPVDGFTLLRALRKLDRNAIVILMSEGSDQGDRDPQRERLCRRCGPYQPPSHFRNRHGGEAPAPRCMDNKGAQEHFRWSRH